MINLFVPLLCAVTTSRVLSHPARYSCNEDEYVTQYESFKVVRQEWEHALDLDPSIVNEGVHTLHSQELVDEDSPQCVQDAAAVFDEFTRVIFKEDHPLNESTVKYFGKDDAHCYQSALLILDEVRTAGGEKVPLNTIEFGKAKKNDDIAERCNGGRQIALSNLANFQPPQNLEDGTVLIYSLLSSLLTAKTAVPLPSHCPLCTDSSKLCWERPQRQRVLLITSPVPVLERRGSCVYSRSRVRLLKMKIFPMRSSHQCVVVCALVRNFIL